MKRITFETEDGLELEGEVHAPDGNALGSAVICHPHPQYGGRKDHPLLWAIRIELAARGFVVFSFNFRGVLRSEATFAGGVDDTKDVPAAVGLAPQESD